MALSVYDAKPARGEVRVLPPFTLADVIPGSPLALQLEVRALQGMLDKIESLDELSQRRSMAEMRWLIDDLDARVPATAAATTAPAATAVAA